jgi:hypothetical protein
MTSYDVASITHLSLAAGPAAAAPDLRRAGARRGHGRGGRGRGRQTARAARGLGGGIR